MNEQQVLKQVRKLIRDQTWEDGSGATSVFADDSVRITVTPRIDAVRRVLRTPFALIRPGSVASDPEYDEEPDLLRASLVVTVGVSNSGDPVGEEPLIGGHRAGTVAAQQRSLGRGILEIEEELFNAVEKLNQIDGVEIYFRAKGAANAIVIEPEIYIAYRDYEFEASVTADRFYHPATKFTAVDAAGAGDADLAWALPPDRFDRFRVMVRRAAGSTPPAGPTDGTEVVLGSNLPTAFTDSPGAGTFSYSIFGVYDETNRTLAEDQRFSAPDSATVTVT